MQDSKKQADTFSAITEPSPTSEANLPPKQVIPHNNIEHKWQAYWKQQHVDVADIASAKKPLYNLMMFPYPSAEGLHVGNMYAFAGSDIYGRYMRMRGYDVFEPIGLDGFGIHSENYALKVGKHPKEHAADSEKHFYEQLHSIGAMFDWTRTVETYHPDYYRWTQWIFVQMFKHGLAYRGKAAVNWCGGCKTVLSDEQVLQKEIDGASYAVCERCGNKVEKKLLEQWFFRITAYAGKLLDHIPSLNWSEKVKGAQEKWIGRSEGMTIKFGKIEVFTTRPDTLNAVTFLATSELYEEGSKEKKGEFSGEYAINSLDGRNIPIWKTNYVAPGYGTGIIMGVPAHDERDMEFASTYHLDIVKKDPDPTLWERIEKEGWGKRTTKYHLRDWTISRQRYWGAPIPMIYCETCAKAKIGEQLSMPGWYAVPEKDLPVLLPDIDDYKPRDDGVGPLAKHKEFYETICPHCGAKAKRETDVCDTFLDSSWYYLRYPSVRCAHSEQVPFDPEITKKWLPVAMYTGGSEHSVLHLMYSRFVTMALHDFGFLDFDEPFSTFFAHGLVIKDGAKMSKSKGNVVNPDIYIEKYGADALRMYLMFMGPFADGGDFRDTGMESMYRFIGRIWRLITSSANMSSVDSDAATHRQLQMAIARVTDDLAKRRYNTAIAGLMECVNVANDAKKPLSTEDAKDFVKLIAPFLPHIAEELWVRVTTGGETIPDNYQSVHKQSWPMYDKSLLLSSSIQFVIQVNGKVRETMQVGVDDAKNQKVIELLVANNEKVKKYLITASKKIIFIPGKLINFVV
ncbi:MAG: class I tRNA ligase family protein [Candidatus Gottesmanbacteria bacterium]